MSASIQRRPRPREPAACRVLTPAGGAVLRTAAAGGAGEGDDTAGDGGARRCRLAGLVRAVPGAAGGGGRCHLVLVVTVVTAVAAGDVALLKTASALKK